MKAIDVVRWLWQSAEKGTRTWRIIITVSFVGFGLWSMGLLGINGTHGFASADDLEKVHKQISSDVAGIKGEVSNLKGGLDSLKQAVQDADQKRAEEARQESIRQVRRQIFETERDACNAKTQEMKDLLLQQAQELRGDFARLTHTEYPPFASCAAYR